MSGDYDFGYAWQWTHGHLVVAAVCALLAALAWRRRILRSLFQIVSVWAVISFGIVWFLMSPNQPLELPTNHFLTSGQGRVVDLGAGSGRASVAVLLAKPAARVIAVDLFKEGYGIDGNSPQRLLANARAAGVEGRLEILSADVRKLPLETASVEGAISSFVIDHLSRTGMAESLREIHRALKPGGEFLLIVINRDRWIAFAYPFLHGHGYFGQMPARKIWINRMTGAGFAIAEDGTMPGILYIVGRKP
jgi:SAM-dependent methyltransferase